MLRWRPFTMISPPYSAAGAEISHYDAQVQVRLCRRQHGRVFGNEDLPAVVGAIGSWILRLSAAICHCARRRRRIGASCGKSAMIRFGGWRPGHSAQD